MGRKAIDISGQKFGQWTVLEQVGIRHRHTLFICICDCGKKSIVIGEKLRNGKSKSCGCRNIDRIGMNTKHGKISTPEYDSWHHMKSRCLNPNNKDFKHYGGRGILVCERWIEFENFYEDMGTKPSKELSLDRINNDGNYEPGNCRWATKDEQNKNRKRNLK